MGNRNKIALFLPDLAGGGAERMMLQVAGGLVGQGYAVDLVLVKRKGAYLSSVPQGVRVVDLGGRRMVRSIGPMVRYLKQEHPRVLLSSLTGTNVIALVAKRLARVQTKVIVRQASIASHERASSPYRLIRYAGRLIPWLYPRADRVIAISNGVADDLCDRFGMDRQKITVIYNPVLGGLAGSEITTETEEQGDGQGVEHPWFAKGHPPVVLGAGRLTPVKGFDVLIRAFAKARKEVDARLLILGEGAERDRLEQLANELGVSENVSLPGFVEDLSAYMKRADVFVFSSRAEGFGNVLVEAMAVGVPVIASECPGGPREILDGGRYGVLVPVGDAVRLAKAIGDVLGSGVDVEAARERAGEFSAQKILPKYFELVGGLMTS